MSSTTLPVLPSHRSIAARLPPELLDDILLYCTDDERTLASCTMVCRSWMALAYPHRFAKYTVKASHQHTFDDFLQDLPHALSRCWIKQLHLCPASIVQLTGWWKKVVTTANVTLEARVLSAICDRLPRLESIILSVPPSVASSLLLPTRHPGTFKLKSLRFEPPSLIGVSILNLATVLSYFSDIEHLSVHTPKLTTGGVDALLPHLFNQPTVHNLSIVGHKLRYLQLPDDRNTRFLHFVLDSRFMRSVSTDGDHYWVASTLGRHAEKLALLKMAGEQYGGFGEDVLADMLEDCQALSSLRLHCFLGVTYMDFNAVVDRQRDHWWRQILRALIRVAATSGSTLREIDVTFTLQERLPANIEEDSMYPEDRRPGPNIPRDRIARHLAGLDWSLVPLIAGQSAQLQELNLRFDLSGVCARDGWQMVLGMMTQSAAVTACLQHERTRELLRLEASELS